MTPSIRKQAVDELVKEQANAWSAYRALGESIKGLQTTCNHDWEYDGHGHNYDRYTCTICGADERR